MNMLSDIFSNLKNITSNSSNSNSQNVNLGQAGSFNFDELKNQMQNIDIQELQSMIESTANVDQITELRDQLKDVGLDEQEFRGRVNLSSEYINRAAENAPVFTNLGRDDSDVITPRLDGDATIHDELKRTKQHIDRIKVEVDSKIDILNSMANNKSAIHNANILYRREKTNLKNKYDKESRENKINKRLVDFYNKDNDFKKTIIGYFKTIYIFLIGLSVLTIVYKKQYRNIRNYIFLLILFIVPTFLVKRIYKIIISVVGHTKLDILYLTAIILMTGLGFVLFTLVKMVFKEKKMSEKDLLEMGKIKNMVKDSLSKSQISKPEKQIEKKE